MRGDVGLNKRRYKIFMKAYIFILLSAICFWEVCSAKDSDEAEFNKLRSAANAMVGYEFANNFVAMYSMLYDGVRNSISLEKFVQFMSSPPRRMEGKYSPISTTIVRGNPNLGYVIMKSELGEPPVLMIMVMQNEEWRILSFPKGRAGRMLDTFIQKKLNK